MVFETVTRSKYFISRPQWVWRPERYSNFGPQHITTSGIDLNKSACINAFVEVFDGHNHCGDPPNPITVMLNAIEITH